MTRSAVVICPGRGTYNAPELGYLARHFPDAALLRHFDQTRVASGQTALSALDSGEKFTAATHTRGDNASALIYAASLGDFLSLADTDLEILAVTGNSMGWYTTLACGGALSAEDGFHVANTMGTRMHKAMIGGQILYPWMDPDWTGTTEARDRLLVLVAELDARPKHALTLSIDLGGVLVLAGNAEGLAAFEAAVPPVQDRFPMRLANHAAFHSALQAPVAARGRTEIDHAIFGQPRLPMIDGRGAIWWPGATDTQALWDYTLGAQVCETYDFTRAVTVAAREFAPDLFILAGPGTTLGGAVAQSLLRARWHGLQNKADFQAVQAQDPLLLSMGRQDQRTLAIQGAPR